MEEESESLGAILVTNGHHLLTNQVKGLFPTCLSKDLLAPLRGADKRRLEAVGVIEQAGAPAPRGQSLPRDNGWSGLPVIFVTTPSFTWARMPHFQKQSSQKVATTRSPSVPGLAMASPSSPHHLVERPLAATAAAPAPPVTLMNCRRSIPMPLPPLTTGQTGNKIPQVRFLDAVGGRAPRPVS